MAREGGYLPKRAFRDSRLSASALRLLACYAYHDRGGKNGQACYARCTTVSDETEIHYRNLSRYDRELQSAGYIEIWPNPKDKRQRMVRVISDDEAKSKGEADAVDNSLDGTTDASSAGEVAINADDNTSAIVVTSEPQGSDSNNICLSKEILRSNARDPAKQRRDMFQETSAKLSGGSPDFAQQYRQARGQAACDGQLTQPPECGSRSNWNRWAEWLAKAQRITPSEAMVSIFNEIDAIREEKCLDHSDAEKVLDKRLRSRRWRHDKCHTA